MDALLIISGVSAFCLFLYLVAALLKPEMFP
jgi:K+-transporting ATPase KdpF subunit